MRSLKGISKKARVCLSSGETMHVEFKEKVSGLESEDLVAFANSEGGGSILIGVKESADLSGMQVGAIVGHRVDDGTRLQILDKAQSCHPPVQIEIVVENLNDKPFLRIEIPSGNQKPYSTKSGTYKIRESGRNAALYAPQLLKIFMEKEGNEFKRRFSDATGQIADRLSALVQSIATLEEEISDKVESIGTELGWADYKVDDTRDGIDTVQALMGSLVKTAKEQTERIRAISKKVDAQDPVKSRAEAAVRSEILKGLKEKPNFVDLLRAGKAKVELQGTSLEEFEKDELVRIVQETVSAFQAEQKAAKP
jgi:hypothetical protein